MWELGGRAQQNGGSDLRGMMKLLLGMSLEAEGCVTNRNSNKSKENPLSVAPDFHLPQCALSTDGSRQRNL